MVKGVWRVLIEGWGDPRNERFHGASSFAYTRRMNMIAKAKYRRNLPQLLPEKIFVSDGGVETTLVFHDGVDLPDFAAFTLLKNESGRTLLRRKFCDYADIARKRGVGIVLESSTWRANSDWGTRLGYSADELARANERAIELLEGIRNEYEDDKTTVVISGMIGPRGDGYDPKNFMTEEEAEEYHRLQIETLAKTNADMVGAQTMTYADEAIGIARAAKKAGMPVVIGFTVETDGNLPSGEALKVAITRVDEATDNYPVYYMINCAHPTHFKQAIEPGAAWVERIFAVRANSSTKSHAELNESAVLDEGDPVDLGKQYKELRRIMPKLHILGGCCGTDPRHVDEIAKACTAT